MRRSEWDGIAMAEVGDEVISGESGCIAGYIESVIDEHDYAEEYTVWLDNGNRVTISWSDLGCWVTN